MNADDVAHAVIIAAEHFQIDPVKVIEDGRSPRYFAMRLLLKAFPAQHKPMLARLVGYSRSSSVTIVAPSQEKFYRFDPQSFDKQFAIYEEKLQNRAREQQPADDTDNKTQRFDNPPLTFTAPDKPIDPAPDAVVEKPLIKLPEFVQVAAPVINPRRTRLEEELRRAILNTGGRLVDK